MQAKISKAWALRPAEEASRAMCDSTLLRRDLTLISTVHSEATKQVECVSVTNMSSCAAWCVMWDIGTTANVMLAICAHLHISGGLLMYKEGSTSFTSTPRNMLPAFAKVLPLLSLSQPFTFCAAIQWRQQCSAAGHRKTFRTVGPT